MKSTKMQKLSFRKTFYWIFLLHCAFLQCRSVHLNTPVLYGNNICYVEWFRLLILNPNLCWYKLNDVYLLLDLSISIKPKTQTRPLNWAPAYFASQFIVCVFSTVKILYFDIYLVFDFSSDQIAYAAIMSVVTVQNWPLFFYIFKKIISFIYCFIWTFECYWCLGI